MRHALMEDGFSQFETETEPTREGQLSVGIVLVVSPSITFLIYKCKISLAIVYNLEICFVI